MCELVQFDVDAGEAISPPGAILVIYLATCSDGARSEDNYSLCFLL